MTPDGAAVKAARAAAGLELGAVAHRMRRRGLPGTTAHWVSMVERGRWGDCPEEWLAVLAAVLGVPPAQIGGRPRLRVLEGGRA